MHVGILEVVIHVPQSRSLKDKRQVVRGLLDRARERFHVAAAEVGDQETWQKATLGFASVSESASHAEEVVQQVLEHVRRAPGAVVASHAIRTTTSDDE